MTTKWHSGRRRFLLSSAYAGAAFAMPGVIRANAADATINKWIDEFQPSTLTRDQPGLFSPDVAPRAWASRRGGAPGVKVDR